MEKDLYVGWYLDVTDEKVMDEPYFFDDLEDFGLNFIDLKMGPKVLTDKERYVLCNKSCEEDDVEVDITNAVCSVISSMADFLIKYKSLLEKYRSLEAKFGVLVYDL